MLYHPGEIDVFAVGTEADLKWATVPAEYHHGIAASAAFLGTNRCPVVPALTAQGISRAVKRGTPTHSGGNFRAWMPEEGLSDEEWILLGEHYAPHKWPLGLVGEYRSEGEIIAERERNSRLYR